MSTRASGGGTAASPLLYWLLVVCGLAGLTVQRFDTPGELVPLWAGTVAGVALGQLIAALRVRPWVLGAVAMGAAWFSPVFMFVLYESIRGPVEICALAFLPAALCGYLSLTERGALAAFWYPAVLWMLVILDGSSAFETRAALPFVIGLAVLFVAYLRARETRRVALWQAHADARLATSLPRAVLRASPVRAASSFAWTGLVGAGALVLAAWIAPHLWQKEQSKHPTLAAAPPIAEPSGSSGGLPCCSASGAGEEKRVRPREYFTLRGQAEQESRSVTSPCMECRYGQPVATAAEETVDLTGATSGTSTVNASSWASSSSGVTATVSPSVPQTTPLAPAAALEPATEKPTKPASHATSPTKPKEAAAVPAAAPLVPTPSKVTPSPSAPPAVVVVVTKPAGSSSGANAPWRSMLAFCLGGLALHILARAVRRQLTLRHLARPFWAETLDQRISNHWERVLIGLRDAGIRPARGEQPHAFAKRVALDGMETCSTILERVRHGVRVDLEDLASMDAAAGNVYRAARAKAGIAGRTAAWIRGPLA